MRWFLLQPYYLPFTTHGPSRRLPLLVLALEGATSYVLAELQRDMARLGFVVGQIQIKEIEGSSSETIGAAA